jgi:hypothetical protein
MYILYFVSETQPIPEIVASDTSGAEVPLSTPHSRRKRLIAVILSTLVPGSGQLVMGHHWQSYLFFVSMATVSSLYWPARLPQYYKGFLFLILAAIFLWVIAASHALVSHHSIVDRFSSWWLLLVFPVAFLASIVFSNLKRVMAMGGSTVRGEDTIIFVDGVELTEPYVFHAGYPQEQLDNFGPVAVPSGKLFVMGDNRGGQL